MQNNTIGTIAMKTAKLPRKFQDRSYSVHTTMDFGSVIPANVTFMEADSKMVVEGSERLLAASMPAPTFGKMLFKGVHKFVPVSDLTENYAPLMAQQGVSRGNQQFVPQCKPRIRVRDLSLFMLWGAKCTIGVNTFADSATTLNLGILSYTRAMEVSGPTPNPISALPENMRKPFADMFISQNFNQYGLTNAWRINSMMLLNDTDSSADYRTIPLANDSAPSFFNVMPDTSYYQAAHGYLDLETVTPHNADIIVPVNNADGTNRNYYLMFRLSSFGKRLRKVLIGCGCQFNLNTTAYFDLLQLEAFYKAYFDSYQPVLYTNWEQSSCYQFQRMCDLMARPEFNDFWQDTFTAIQGTAKGYLQDFIIKELGATFYTDEQDFVSSHTRTDAISPDFSDATRDLIDTNGANPPIVSVDSSSDAFSGASKHSYINNVIHSQLDSELLKRLYRTINRNTIAGRRIAEVLRAQGFGKYVDECKSDYIGDFELLIDVMDVYSSSDTFSDVNGTEEGSFLGERAGAAQAERKEKPLVFETFEEGFWVTLLTVVPRGGYSEAFDPHALATEKFELYNADFDSIGKELNPKLLVHGSMPWVDWDVTQGSLDDAFGAAPRYFKYKFGRNVLNGDFSRRGKRAAYLPFCLDKFIPVGERLVIDNNSSGSSDLGYIITRLFPPKNLPVAGTCWRYPTRYPYIGAFNRIFNKTSGTYESGTTNITENQAAYEFFGNMDDNWVLHCLFAVKYFVGQKPVEQSFETDDDGKYDSAASKA